MTLLPLPWRLPAPSAPLPAAPCLPKLMKDVRPPTRRPRVARSTLLRATHLPLAASLVLGTLAAGIPGRAAGAQTPAYCATPSTRTAARVGVASGAVAGNVALQVYFKNAWWAGEKAEEFWFNNDWDMSFRDQDKFGHLFGGYHLSRAGTELLEAGCFSPTTALLWGSVYAALFQLQIEVWDGYQAKYGFSPPDLLANTVGTGFFVARELVPGLRHVKPTMSYWPTEAYRRRESHANSELRATVDYSGQTYWFSADVDAMLPDRAARWWPGLLRLSVGHGITDWVDPVTGQTQRAGRRILLSIDVDAEKLPGRHPVWVRVKRELGYIRFPAPALQIYPGLEGVAWYR